MNVPGNGGRIRSLFCALVCGVLVMSASAASDSPAAQPLVAQTLGTSFTGATLITSGRFPPDAMGAPGPSQFLVAVNGRIVTFNKSTGTEDGAMNVTTTAFFTPVRTPGAQVTAYPRVRYDRFSARWFIVMMDATLSGSNVVPPNRVMIAFSDQASAGVISAATVWSFVYFNSTSASCYIDSPTLGIDNSALYVGANNYCPDISSTDGYVLPKASLLAGGSLVVYRIPMITGSPYSGLYGPQGVDNYDPSSSEGYFIGVDGQGFGKLMLRRISNPGAVPPAAPGVSADIPIVVAPTTFSRTVPHLGNTGGTNGFLAGLDDSLLAAHIRNGRLWTAHNFAVGSNGVASTAVTRRNAVRWYELNRIRSTDDDGVPIVVQSGTVYDATVDVDSARHYWVPTVMVSGQGHAALGFSTAGAAFRADAATTGRLAGDGAGTMRDVSLYTASTSGYNPPGDPGGPNGRRWGSYSYTSLDPIDDMTMWTIQEFSDASNSWGVRVVKLNAPPPATPASSSPATIDAGFASTSVLISGTSTSGSGFFDPGPNLSAPAVNFAHITGTVTGGVTVNSATYVSPTQVILDLNTAAATAGPVDVTITNPDGQLSTGTAILTLNPGPVPTSIIARAVSVSEVEVTWTGVSGATLYEVQRSTGGAYAVVGTSGTTTFSDAAVVAGKTYLYKVRRLAPSAGPLSVFDLATTIFFVDDPLSSGIVIKADHVMECRAAVTSVRIAAGLVHNFPYTDGSLAGVTVKADHIDDLRAAINAAYTALGLPAITYANAATPGTIIRNTDLTEIRQATK